MSYLVLALGTLLSLCGAISISASYGIIQVERGWAGVIAGATALSGGLVTIALGFILHSLSSLHALLKTGTCLAPLPHEIGEDEARQLRAEPGLGFNPETSMVAEAGPLPATMPPASSLRTWPQRPTRFSLTPARHFLKAHGTGVPAARGTPVPDVAVPKPPFASCATTSVSTAAVGPASELGSATASEVATGKAQDEAKTRPASSPAKEAPAGPALYAGREPGLFDNEKGSEPPMRVHTGEPETESLARVASPAEIASIDATFGDDHLIAPDPALDAQKEGAKPSPEAIDLASLHSAPSFVSETLPVADPREPSPPAVPAASETGLAIVGRYESEGTSYVMYANGSIEARSERGVFHFQSMAELKAFMEAQA
jgi:hypothetical protein